MAADLKDLRKLPQPSPTTVPPSLADAPPPSSSTKSSATASKATASATKRRTNLHQKRSTGSAPQILSVADDPTIHELAGMKLAGSYDYDNEGSPAQRVEVIQNAFSKIS